MKPSRFTFPSIKPGERLDQFLFVALPKVADREITRSLIRRLIMGGAVFVNRRPTRVPALTLVKGMDIEVVIDWAKVNRENNRTTESQFTSLTVLYEDEGLIAVDKPAGLPSQPTVDAARPSVFTLLKAQLAKKTGHPEPYVALHHRLDLETSGVLLLVKNPDYNKSVSELFSAHKIEKTYQALSKVKGKLEAEWKVQNHLGVAGKQGKAKKYGSVRAGGDLAITRFKLGERVSPSVALIEAKPQTGRTHQIRVHLSEAGMPILGDALYGSARAKEEAPRCLLHAASLTFVHPVNNLSVTIQSPLPEDFKTCLVRYRGGSAGS